MTITLETIKQEIRKIAGEQPDFVYSEQFLNKFTEGDDVFGSEECSYLGSIRKYVFEELQEKGALARELSYEEAVEKNLIGQRCIVGQALHNLGVSDTFLYKYEGDSAENVVRSATDFPESQRPLIARWAGSVQAAQDCGIAWGRAVEIADEQWEMGV